MLLQKMIQTPLLMTKEELSTLIQTISDKELQTLMQAADTVRREHFGDTVYLRALIEFSSHCAQDCYYCGLRHSNSNAQRYRLNLDTILDCCTGAYELGYRTFVLQSGEDFSYSRKDIYDIVYAIKSSYPDTAITLSIGEKSYDDYKAYFDAGADRYLLRHEAASRRLYELIHPETMSYDNRHRCLRDLKEIGFQVGAGFMVGLPTQTADDLAEDIIFIRNLRPHMVGIGPYLTHKDTPFCDKNSGTLRETLIMLALTRLTLPDVLLPATTSLETLEDSGRSKGLITGANVIMPNVSPQNVRKKYMLYDNKFGTTGGAEEMKLAITNQIQEIGFNVDMQVGHHPSRSKTKWQKHPEEKEST